MDILDFIIGATLMNAIPHFVLGVWKGRMFSVFGFGDTQNIAYGLLNFAVSLGLVLLKYGLAGLAQNGIYAGALTLLVIYFLTGRFWYTRFNQSKIEKTERSHVT